MWRTCFWIAILTLTACMEDNAEDEAPPFADPQAGCSLGCHGTEVSTAPPQALGGITATTARGVGAHRAHVGVAATWHRQVVCSDCHNVPAEVGAPGHLDGDNKAELTFGSSVSMGSMWNGTSCTTGCHGNAAFGGTSPTPVWTQVDGSQSTCGSCHGTPPPAPHPTGANCASCHPTMEESSLTFRDPASHIDGKVDVVGAGTTGGCTSCHGSTTAAPPKDLSGDTLPSAPGVGAHTAHLAASPWRRAMPCTSCHKVPTMLSSPGHLDGDNAAELTFDALNPAATYTRGTSACSNLYCHGNGRGSTGTASWVSETDLTCTSCHTTNGTGMSGDHRRHIQEEGMRCSECHADVINANQAIIKPELHVNGLHEVKMAAGTFNPATKACTNTGCHGTERW